MKNLRELVSGQQRKPPSLSDFPQEVGARLRRQRMAFSWRQADLAERAGVSVQTVKSVEKGDPVAYESLLRLLLALGHGVDFLRMLESPHFPTLRAQERYLELSATNALKARRVRSTLEGRP
ncbi:helix-turn-helix domain-containing protein [Dyella sp. 2RAB6]|uniref:helix-turn-helix domain-containing protein n=1 Tax=Dyella sp. 2RAB6 TaxID=3232992 RepID=UPI003F90FA4E